MTRPWRKPRVTPDDDAPKIREFAGLVNTVSEKDVGLRALTIADNILISDSKKIRTRPGKTLYRAGAMRTAYVLGGALYVVDGGALQRVLDAATVVPLTSGLTGTDYCWDEVNGEAYFVNGVDAGIIRRGVYLPLRLPAPVLASVTVSSAGTAPAVPFNFGAKYTSALWRFCATYETADGRESPPSEIYELAAPPNTHGFRATVAPLGVRTNVYVTEPDGTVFRLAATSAVGVPDITVLPSSANREFTQYNTFALPDEVDQIAYWNARMWVAQYFASEDQSVVWKSRPFAYHLYDMGSDYMVLPGRVALLLWNNQGLLIGTTQAIYQHTDDGKLDMLVNYGVLPGVAGDLDAESMAYFWTTRGFCRAMPFENLTEKQVGMPPGLRANTRLLYLDGMQQLVTVTQGGGTPFNARSAL